MKKQTPHFGRVLWSNYFKARIVVVYYKDDNHWNFVVEGEGDDWSPVMRANTTFSDMLALQPKEDHA